MKRFSIFDFRLAISSFRFPSASLRRAAVAQIANRKSLIQNAFAFSLVEVTLALGITSFALIPVLGLLPVGLKSVKNANEQAGAANVLNAIADSLRSATSTDSTNFAAYFGTNRVNFSVKPLTVIPVNTNWSNLKLDGSTESTSDTKRIAAVVNIIPSTNLTTPVRAVISVAWPAQNLASSDWDTNNQTWARAEGSITAGIQFLPKP